MPRMLSEIIPHVHSIAALETALWEEKLRFASLPDYLDWLDKTWKEENKEKLDAILAEPLGDANMPCRIIEQPGGIYKIKGFIHGGEKWLTPGWHPRKELKYFLRADVQKSWHGFPNVWYSSIQLSEQNLSEFLGLGIDELKDHHLGADYFSEGTLAGDIVKLMMAPLAIVSSIVFNSVAYLLIDSSKGKHGLADEWLMIQSLKDPRYLPKYEEYDSASRLPEPLGWEFDYLKWKTGQNRFTKFYNNFMDSPAPYWQRDIYMAKAMESHGNEHWRLLGPNTVELYCGMHHVYGISDTLGGILPSVKDLDRYHNLWQTRKDLYGWEKKNNIAVFCN